MKRNNGTSFILLLVLIGALTYLAFKGLDTGTGFKINSAYDIRQGIDIRGGIHTTLYPDVKPGTKVNQKDLESAKTVIEKRLDSKNIFDRTITLDQVNGRVIVEIPWRSEDKDLDPQKAIKELGQMSRLTFQEIDETKVTSPGGVYLPTGKIVLEGKDIADAKLSTQNNTTVELNLTSEGAQKFAEATGRLVGKKIGIFMDDYLTGYPPTVKSQITGGNAIIEGQRSTEDALDLAATIRSGSLPFGLTPKEVNVISPSLGAGALNVSVQAGVVAFIMVCLFMLGYYRLPGILANIALLAHTVLQLLVISISGITMTLPGIAGIILTVGMGVDANVIIFERIKEEIRNGKTLRTAIDVGFRRAFTAVFDANMTTLITAVVLYIFGTGPIKGFAMTLGLGVFLSFFTAVTVSRIMLKSVANTDIAKHHWLYGV